jgi:tRNA(fMet)-specific endonuclease VapC
MRKHPLAAERAESYLDVHRQFTFSIITRYEILRGLLAKGAAKQIAEFDQLCASSSVLPIDDSVVEEAARIYADLHKRGVLIGDGDILIAASAIIHNLALATNNIGHFRRIQHLRIENWLV